MSKAKRTVEERIAELDKRQQDMLEKASQLKAQKKELEKRYKEEQKKARTHRLCQIGGAVELVLGSTIEEADIPKLIGFLKRQEENGSYFSRAMGREPKEKNPTEAAGRKKF